MTKKAEKSIDELEGNGMGPEPTQLQVADDFSWENYEEQGHEGTVCIFENEGESLTGIFRGIGRKIGKEGNEVDTWAIFDLEEHRLFLVPSSAVLDKKVAAFIEKRKEKGDYNLNHVVQIIYLGKKKSTSNTGREYKDYMFRSKVANEDENNVLPVDYQLNPVDLSKITV